MKLVDRIKTLLSGKTPATVRELTEDMRMVEVELQNAESAATAARKAHDDSVLDRLIGGKLADASKSRDAVLLADDRVTELRSVTRALQARLDAARQAEDENAKRLELERLEATLARRKEAAERLNATIETLAKQFNEVFDLGVEAWGMLNPRPPSVYGTIAAGDLAAKVSMRLFGVSNGRLGSSHLPPSVCLERLDIAGECANTAQRMMRYATGPAAQLQEAA
jgi:hypothetical protein